MLTTTIKAGLSLSLIAVATTTAFTQEGNNHEQGAPVLPRTAQGTINQAPPFQTLPPGHSPDDGHDHTGHDNGGRDHSGHDHGRTNPTHLPVPARTREQATPPGRTLGPFYDAPNRFDPTTNRPGQFHRGGGNQVLPPQLNLSYPETGYPDSRFDCRYQGGCSSPYGCSSASGVNCPLAGQLPDPPPPVQRYDFSDPAFSPHQWQQPVQPVGVWDSINDHTHACPYGHH